MAYSHFNIEQSGELLEGQSHVWHQVFNFISSMSLKCATELGIPDIIYNHGRPMSLEELVKALNVPNAKSDGVYRLMRLMISSGFFKKVKNIADKDEGVGEEGYAYALTPASMILVENHPFSLKPFVLSQLDPVIKKPWHSLGEWLRREEDQTACNTAYGMSFWEMKESERSFSNGFDVGMASDTPLLSHLITRDCKHMFAGFDSIVDVGGGTGTLARAIADTFPQVQCTVLDFPHVIAGLKDTENLKFVGGDLHEYIPPADCILMKWILHAWNDKISIEILKRCKGAIRSSRPEGGKVIIMEMTVDEHSKIPNAYETTLYLDMLTMALNRGKERTEAEWAKLIFDAGFSTYKITHLSGIKSIIEAFP